MKRVALLMLSGLFLAACNTVTWGPNLYHWGDANSVGKPMSPSASITPAQTWQNETTAEAEEDFTDMAMEVDDFSQSAEATESQNTGIESGTFGGTETGAFSQGTAEATESTETAEATATNETESTETAEATESVETEIIEETDTVTDAVGKDFEGFEGK